MLRKLSLDATRLGAVPSVATHTAPAPRIAFMHTWLGTQNEGWWRLAFDKAGVPYSYISTQAVASEGDLRGKYDVIVFAPVGRAASQDIITACRCSAMYFPGRRANLRPTWGCLIQLPTCGPAWVMTGLRI